MELAYTQIWNSDRHGYTEDVDLTGATLNYAYFEKANLKNANLSTNLKDSFLLGVNLQGVNLQDAHLQGAILTNAKYNTETIIDIIGIHTIPTKFPDNFDPESNRMIINNI